NYELIICQVVLLGQIPMRNGTFAQTMNIMGLEYDFIIVRSSTCFHVFERNIWYQKKYFLKFGFGILKLLLQILNVFLELSSFGFGSLGLFLPALFHKHTDFLGNTRS